MCGICGIFGKEDKGLLLKMMSVIKHRGPDDSGIFLDNNISLGHQRLSIIDLSENGRQPIHNEDETIWISYNGEIYNYLVLRKTLEALGHTFYSNTDTEVIVHGYEEWGFDVLKRINGMFSFSLWDSEKKQLFLARDRFGIKPLFYAMINGLFFFSSEIKSILQYDGYKPRVNYNVLTNFLEFSYSNTLHNTFFKDIRKLPPAHMMIVSENGISLERYWNITYNVNNASEDYLANKLLTSLKSSVEKRLISDVPVGVYLSGGLDSSSIVGLMAQLTSDINTFSVGFGDYGESELEYSRLISEEFNTNHHEIIVEPDSIDLNEVLLKLIWFSDEPLVDFAMIPIYLMSRKAKRDITTVLTGEGGDETQGGYVHFLSHKKLKNMGNYFPKKFLTLASQLTKKLPDSSFSYNLDYAFQLMLDPNSYGKYTRYFRDGEITKLFSDKLIKEIKPISKQKITSLDICEDIDFLDLMLTYDINTILANSYLSKTDRSTMAASIEARVPFLDHELVEFMFSVPSHLKINKSQTKYLFRKSMKNILPPEIIKRPKKGFGVPVASWLKENKAYIYSILDEDIIKKRGYFKNKYVQNILKDIDKFNDRKAVRIWNLATFELWNRIYIDNHPRGY